jgi:hypothetical protein
VTGRLAAGPVGGFGGARSGLRKRASRSLAAAVLCAAITSGKEAPGNLFTYS